MLVEIRSITGVHSCNQLSVDLCALGKLASLNLTFLHGNAMAITLRDVWF